MSRANMFSGSCQAAGVNWLTNNALTELQHDVRVRDGDGQDQAQHAHRSPPSQPAQDGESCEEGDWSRSDSQCVQAPSSADDRAGLQETHEQDWPLKFAFERLHVLSRHLYKSL